MTNKIQLSLTPDSSFLLGGVTVNPAFDKGTALDGKLPYLTATAIKGALRMEFEAFFRGIDEAIDICDMDRDIRGCGVCMACRLFGGGDKEGKLRFNAAGIENPDHVLPPDTRKDILEKGKRQGVSISRTLGNAKDQSLFLYQTFPDMRNVQVVNFKGHIDVREPLNDNETESMRVFFSFLEHSGFFMGARKSAGLGNFKIKSTLPAAFEKPNTIDTTRRELKLFRLTLENLEPLVVGGLKNQYITDSLPYIPAPTLGGSIGFGFSDFRIGEEEIDALFNGRRSFSTFNLYLDHHLPKPASLRKPKGGEKEKDILLDDFLLKKAVQEDLWNDGVLELFVDLYRSSLRPVPISKQPETSYQIKLALDRQLQKSKEGLLYAAEFIQKGSVFSGFVIGEAWTKEALDTMAHLLLGGKRTRGFGRCKILEIKPMNVEELVNDKNSVDTALRELAESCSINLPPSRFYFALELLSNLPASRGVTFEYRLKQELFPGLDMEIEKAFPITIKQGGYDFRKKRVKPLMEKMGAGSTFLVSVPLENKEVFLHAVKGMVAKSVNFNWDSTPLFLLNNPLHTADGGEG